MPRLTVLIFAKYPQPSEVNTRLIPSLSPEEAAELHRASLRAVCENVTNLRERMSSAAVTSPPGHPSGAEKMEPNALPEDIPTLTIICVVTPDDAIDRFRVDIGAAFDDYWPQGDGDLGDRLTRATQRAFDAGVDAVMLLGADSPTVPATLYDQAVEQVGRHDAVLGPCADGGYYVLAMRRCLPFLFERIDWGGNEVAEQTRRRAIDAGVELVTLPPWYDLDRFEDLVRASRDLEPIDCACSPALAALRDLLQRLTERNQT